MQKKKMFIFGIIFLVLSGMGFYYRYQKIAFLDKNRVNMYQITSSGSKMANVDAYINASYLEDRIAIYQNHDDYGFYVVFDEGVQHLVYMKNNDAQKIRTFLLDYPDKSYLIKGLTKTIPSEMEEYGKQFIKSWLDQNHHHEDSKEHSHEISNDEFYQYFGYVYLDATINSFSYYRFLTIICFIFALCGITLLGYIIYPKIFRNN